MIKRVFDIIISFFGLVFASPVLIPVMVLVWWQDRHSPFYIAPRVGKNERLFNMVKLRSMVIDADKSGVDSTSANDNRITPVGQFIRSYKLDELTQLWNVIRGDMSLVGPRPNVKRETDLYTDVEKRLLSVRPGITDFSSIVFSDEGEILAMYEDPDIGYNQLIRPYKSRLSLTYIDNASLSLDVILILLTVLSMISRTQALIFVNSILFHLDVPENVLRVALRQEPLIPAPPPGTDHIITTREQVD